MNNRGKPYCAVERHEECAGVEFDLSADEYVWCPCPCHNEPREGEMRMKNTGSFVLDCLLAVALAAGLLLLVMVPKPSAGQPVPACWEPQHDGKMPEGVKAEKRQGDCFRTIYNSVVMVCEHVPLNDRAGCYESQIPRVGCEAVPCKTGV